ncbi:unnamed protein product [Allacma fusca]|uniref:Uncharacterized protein n=1 Tax=Allacma fusca TaxID=39272 RepID=A0A8J2LQX4_9HEXA|nr:unnamed protein product [Allacma fusca]
MRLSTFIVLGGIFFPACLPEKVSNCSPNGLGENQIALCNSVDLRMSSWDECNSKEIWPPNTIVEIKLVVFFPTVSFRCFL